MNRIEFFKKIYNEGSPYIKAEIKTIQDAYWLAKESYRPFSRSLSNERYFEHVRRVALMAFDEGLSVDAIVISLLHDVLEDTYTPYSVITSMFNVNVRIGVMTLSKELPVFDEITGVIIERKKKDIDDYFNIILYGDDNIKFVKCFDRLDNLSDIHLWSEKRRDRYLLETEKYIIPIANSISGSIKLKLLEVLERYR